MDMEIEKKICIFLYNHAMHLNSVKDNKKIEVIRALENKSYT